jgi:hypothetical protein
MQVVFTYADQIISGDPQVPIPGLQLPHAAHAGELISTDDESEEDEKKGNAPKSGHSCCPFGKRNPGEPAYKLIIVAL